MVTKLYDKPKNEILCFSVLHSNSTNFNLIFGTIKDYLLHPMIIIHDYFDVMRGLKRD